MGEQAHLQQYLGVDDIAKKKGEQNVKNLKVHWAKVGGF